MGVIASVRGEETGLELVDLNEEEQRKMEIELAGFELLKGFKLHFALPETEVTCACARVTAPPLLQVHRSTGESPETLRARKLSHPWGEWLRDGGASTRAARATAPARACVCVYTGT